MITLRMVWDQMLMEVEGHANTAPKGEDLVCAAASMLVQALVRSLQNAEKRGRMNTNIRMAEGSAKIQADPELSSLNEAKAYFRMCITGMRMLAEEYPQNIKVKEV